MFRSARFLSGFVTVFALAIVPALAAADAPVVKPAGHTAATPVVWPSDQLKWIDAPGAPAGVKMAVLWGDPTKGAHGAFHKFPAGFKAPLHTHSSDLHSVIVSGTIIHGEADGKETKLGPGSYLFDPHTEKHTTACDAASECVMFVHASGKFDIKMVEEKAMEKKAAK